MWKKNTEDVKIPIDLNHNPKICSKTDICNFQEIDSKNSTETHIYNSQDIDSKNNFIILVILLHHINQLQV